MCKVKSLLGLWASTNPLAKIRKNGKRKAENGKLFCFSVFAWSGKRNAAIKPRAEGKFICTMPRRSSEARRATDAAERAQRANLFALCRAARRKSLRSRINGKLFVFPSRVSKTIPSTRGRAKNGKRKTENWRCGARRKRLRRRLNCYLIASAEGKFICTMPSREEEKPA